MKIALEKKHQPNTFKTGFNHLPAAGQTIPLTLFLSCASQENKEGDSQNPTPTKGKEEKEKKVMKSDQVVIGTRVTQI